MISFEQARAMRQGITLTGDRNQCAECGQLFNSTAAFDMHRTGSYTERWCLSAEEMEGKGMARNMAGFWVTRRLSEEDMREREAGTTRVG